jgi:D-alanyl-D-alanine carboxypeptidase (penicillin-binding protein 5/6)
MHYSSRISCFSLTILALFALTTPGEAKHPRRHRTHVVEAIPKGAPWNLPNAQELVTRGRIPPFYNPNDLSSPPVISAPASILIDAASGEVLFEKNADARRAIASTTKIMTALLFVEHTKPDDIVTCTDPTVTKIEESSLHIQPGEKFTAENLLYGFLLRSGNDAAVVIAEHVAGSVPAFAAMMNQRATELGCTNTNFVNPNGLTAEGHYSSARDLALIAREAMKNPRFAEAVRLPVRTIQRSMNKGDVHIVSRMKKRFHEKFPGADGIKTGNTQAAGFCFVGSATREGHRLISVVLGAHGGSSINDSVAIQGWGFRRFGQMTVTRQGAIVGNAVVAGGILPTVPVVAAQDLTAVVDRTAPSAVPLTTAFVPVNRSVTAPVIQGTLLGKLVARRGGAILSEVPAIAAQDVRVAPMQAAMHNTGNWFAQGLGNPFLVLMGSSGLCLVLWRTYARTITKSPGSRRTRISSARGGDNRDRASSRGRGDSYTTGNAG